MTTFRARSAGLEGMRRWSSVVGFFVGLQLAVGLLLLWAAAIVGIAALLVVGAVGAR